MSQNINNRYEILELIGEGAIGSVYKVFDLIRKEIIALKMLKKETLNNLQSIAYFKQEFITLTQLKHPNLISVYDFGITADNNYYFTMEYVKGKTLKEIILEEKLTFEEIYNITIQICYALDYIHRYGLLHCDLKPSNLMKIEEKEKKYDFTIKIMDFGLTRVIAHNDTETISGTPAYIAPEMLKNSRLDGRADLYSLGIILYEISTGQLPFDGDSALTIARQHIMMTPPAPNTLNKDIPKPLETIISNLMQKEPSARYPNALAVIQAINEFTKIDYDITQEKIQTNYLLNGKFVNRKYELEYLKKLSYSTEGHFILIGGKSGIGKSRLLEEYKFYAQLQCLSYITGKANLTSNHPYQPIIEVLEKLVDYDKIHNGKVIEEYKSILSRLLPKLQSKDENSLEIGLEKYQLFENIVQFLEKMYKKYDIPFIIILENLHTMGIATLEALVYIISNLNKEGFIFIATFRNDITHNEIFDNFLKEITNKSYTTSLILNPFNQTELEEFIGSILGIEKVPEELITYLSRATAGIPYYVEELMTLLVHNGLIYREGNNWNIKTNSFSDLPLSTTLKELIKEHWKQFSKTAKTILYLASAIGNEFSYELLLALAPQSDEELHATLRNLINQGILLTTQGQLNFVNELTRETLYREISSEIRIELHNKIGILLEKHKSDSIDELAYHFTRANNKDKALFYLEKSAKQAAKLFATQKALTNYLKIIEILNEKLEKSSIENRKDLLYHKFNILRRYNEQLSNCDKIIEAISFGKEMLKIGEELEDITLEGIAWTNIGINYLFINQYDKSKESLFKALELLSQTEAQKELAYIYSGLGNLYSVFSNHTKAHHYHKKANNVLRLYEN